jgi:hypothetical protein
MNIPFAHILWCPMSPHCATCRNKEGGRGLRKSIHEKYPEIPVDFDCPYGRKWGIERKSVKVQSPYGDGLSAEKVWETVKVWKGETPEERNLVNSVAQNIALRDTYLAVKQGCKAKRCEDKILHLWREYELTQRAVASTV